MLARGVGEVYEPGWAQSVLAKMDPETPLVLSSEIEGIKISGYQLDDGTLVALTLLASKLPLLNSLICLSASVQPRQMWVLHKLIVSAPIQSLAIDFNVLVEPGSGLPYPAPSSMYTSLLTQVSLSSLSLRGNHLTDDDASTLASALKSNHSLTSLNLFDNDITDVGAIALSESLRVNQRLVSLSLARNDVSTSGALSLAATLSRYAMSDEEIEMRTRMIGMLEMSGPVDLPWTTPPQASGGTAAKAKATLNTYVAAVANRADDAAAANTGKLTGRRDSKVGRTKGSPGRTRDRRASTKGKSKSKTPHGKGKGKGKGQTGSSRRNRHHHHGGTPSKRERGRAGRSGRSGGGGGGGSGRGGRGGRGGRDGDDGDEADSLADILGGIEIVNGQYFAEGNRVLTNLNLSHNSIAEVGALKLLEAAMANTVLARISLDYNAEIAESTKLQLRMLLLERDPLFVQWRAAVEERGDLLTGASPLWSAVPPQSPTTPNTPNTPNTPTTPSSVRKGMGGGGTGGGGGKKERKRRSTMSFTSSRESDSLSSRSSSGSSSDGESESRLSRGGGESSVSRTLSRTMSRTSTRG